MANTLLTEFQDLGIQVADDTAREADTRLSPRETEVLKLVARGATNREIAEALFISENTVKTHLSNIMEKLHLANRSQAAAYAVRRGLVHYKEP
jgi:DNA-binding NarL/FixJ family response regulator